MFKEYPLDCLAFLVTVLFVVLISLILHECAHGWMAFRCGDPTAKFMGRLSLNPLRHLDPIGTLCMVAIGFGWAKPVPVNPRNFRNFRRDDFLVSIAGIVTNLTLFIISCLLAVTLNMFIWNADASLFIAEEGAEQFVNVFDQENWIAMSISYSVSMSPFTLLTDHLWLLYIQRFLLLMAQINLSLAVFNLLPVPPLDGFHLLNDIILQGRLRLSGRLFQITQFVLLALCFTGVFTEILGYLVDLFGNAVVRTILMIFGQG